MNYRNAIWDFDGTLYDTYPVMLEALLTVYARHQVPVQAEALYRLIKQQSIKVALRQLAQTTGVGFEMLDCQYHELEQQTQLTPQPYVGAAAILAKVSQRGQNFLLTHRDQAAQTYLAQQGLDQYFTEIVTSQQPFARKPAPDSLLYICEKYALKPAETVMIGDRALDVEAGINAGVQSVYFDVDHLPIMAQPTVAVHELSELLPLFE